MIKIMNSYTYKINNLSVDLEKKLSLYKEDYNKKQEYCFHDKALKEFSSILVKIGFSDISIELKNFNEKYKVELILNNNSLVYPWGDISALSSELYSTLYYQFKSKAFEKFLDIIKNKLPRNNHYDWFSLSFENDEIKNDFLDDTTKYIIENQISPEQWVEDFKNIDVEKHRWLRDFNIKTILKKFNNLNEIFFWFKKNGHHEYFRLRGSSLVDSLLFSLIRMEETNKYFIFNENKTYERVNKIIKECRNDYMIIGNIFTSNNIKLDTYFLTKKEYALYGFLNLYNLNLAPNYSVSDDNMNYMQQWQEMLSNQLVNIYFEHFKYAQNKDSFSKPLYSLLNYLVSEHIGEYNNQYHYKENYTLKKVLEKIAIIEISISQYDKKYLFDIIIEDIVNEQLERFVIRDEFNITDYFLLSWYLEQIGLKQKVTDNDYGNLVNNITTAILDNLTKCINIATNEDKFYINNEILERVSFGLIFSLSKEKERWLNLLDISKIRKQLNSNDIYMPREISEFYLKILIKIYKSTQDDNVAKYITKLVVEVGIKERNGVFSDWQDNRLLDDFLEILNSFNDNLFNEFTTEFYKQKSIKNVLQLYNFTLVESRKIKIKEEINNITQNLTYESIPYLKDLEDAMVYASANELRELNNNLFNIYKNNSSKKGHPSRKKEYAEIICKNEMLNIYYDDTLSRDKKHIKLNKCTKKIKDINDKNHGVKSIQIKCENYQSFVHAIVWFKTEPITTYQMLRALCNIDLNSLYLINMLSAYFKAFENDKNKKEKFFIGIKEYLIFSEKLINDKKSLHDYYILLYGYKEINDVKQFMILWNELENSYKNEFSIMEIRCEFLKNNNQSLDAIEYVTQYKDNNIEKSNEELEKLNTLISELQKSATLDIKDKLGLSLEIKSTRLDLYDAQNFWNRIKNMNSEEHAQIFLNTQNLNEFIAKIMSNISAELLERKSNIIRNNKNNDLEHEDIINDWVASLLKQRMSFLNWNIKDQTRGGKSDNDETRTPGERDIIAENHNGDKIFLFEAFILSSATKNKILKHVDKLDGYNASGCQNIVLMIYSTDKNFQNLCTNYTKYLKTFNYKGFDKIEKLDEHQFHNEIEISTATIKVFSEIRLKNGAEIKIYHYILDFYDNTVIQNKKGLTYNAAI